MDARLNDPKIWQGEGLGQGEDPHKLTEKRTATQAETDTLYQRWEELEELSNAEA